MAEHHVNALRLQELNAGYLIEYPEELENKLAIAFNTIKQGWSSYKNACQVIRDSFINSPDHAVIAKKIVSIMETI